MSSFPYRASSLGSKSFTSMATQTDPQDFLNVGDGAEERLVKARTNLLWQTTQGVLEHAERNRRTCGQIQQRVVTRCVFKFTIELVSNVNWGFVHQQSLVVERPSKCFAWQTCLDCNACIKRMSQSIDGGGNKRFLKVLYVA